MALSKNSIHAAAAAMIHAGKAAHLRRGLTNIEAAIRGTAASAKGVTVADLLEIDELIFHMRADARVRMRRV